LTGLSIPVIGMDGKSIAHGAEEKTQRAIEDAIAQGITFFDTSVDHMSGRSERRYGNMLVPKYRDQIFLQSRCMARTKAVLPKVLDISLARLETDYLDSFLLESVITGNVDEQLETPAPDAFEGLLAARKAGKVRVVGIRTPADTSNLQNLLDLYGTAVDMVMIPKSLPENDRAVVKARKLGIGIVADVDRGEQKRWKKPDQTNVFPDYISSWVLEMNNTKETNTLYKRAMRLKESK
jgi:predicted aldo/keto reductase-like oxidoreductase